MRLHRLSALFILALVSRAQDSSVWRSWRMADGLYESYIHSIAPGADGTLWVTHGRSIAGATLMDGYGTRKVALPTVPRPFDRLFGEAGGWSWGMTAEGFQILDPSGAWSMRAVPGVRGAVAAQPLAPGKAVLLKPDQLLAYDFRANAVTLLWDGRASDIGPFSEMSGDPGHDLWIAGERGVGRLRRDSGGWQWVEFHQWPQPLTRFRFLNAAADGAAFVTASASKTSHVLLRYDGRQWQTLHRTAVADSRAWAGADDIVWIQQGADLGWRQGNALHPVDRTSLLSDDIRQALPEPDGSFWLATYDGVVRNAPRLWRTPSGPASLGSPTYAVEDDGGGGFWILTQDRLIHHTADRWDEIPIPEAWRPVVLRNGSLLVLRDGRLAMAGGNGKLQQFDPRSARFSELAPPAGTSLERLTTRGDGTAWAVLRTGNHVALAIFDGAFHPRDDLQFDWDTSGILAVHQSSDGAIWIGSANWLAVYRNGQFRRFGPQDGYTDTGVFSVAEVAPGRIWFGGRSTVMEFDGRNWKTLLNADRTRAILPTRDGSVWTASTDGVYRFKNGAWIEYGLPEGLPSTVVYSVHQDAGGHIWAGTTRGVGLFHPEADPDPPRAYVQAGQNPREASLGEVRILVSAVDRWRFTPAARLLCSYRIDSGSWSAFDACAPAVYKSLPKGPHHFEVRAMDRNGNVSPQPASFDFSVVPPWYLSNGFFMSAGLATAIIGILLILLAVNFTHRGRLITQLRKAHAEAGAQREKAEQASMAKSRFLANMSHEIRTPMNGVLGMAELARHAETSSEREEYLRSLQQSARSLLSILNDILDLSKIEAGKVELNRERFKVRDCLSEALQPLAVPAGQKNLELVLRVARDVPSAVIGDPVRLRQVLVNIVGNAVKFTHQGEIVVDVSAGERIGGSVTLRFRVRDTGLGIPPEKQDLIFQAFEQGDDATTRRFGGAGLGLAISARFVEMMGGRLAVQSPIFNGASPGGPGTEFRFDASFEIPPDATPAEDLRELAGVPVLIVEDNPSTRDALTGILAEAGMKVTPAADSADALRRLESESFAAAVVDRTLPDLEGYELARRIRHHANGAKMPIILLNTPGRQTVSTSAESSAAGAVLQKPIHSEDLLRALLRALKQGPSGASQSTPESTVSPRQASPLRILIVEDNLTNQFVARRLLETRGHHVQIAKNGREAVAACEQAGFDLVLMDLEMPVMDGWEATETIRRAEAETGRARLPIVALTAHAMKGHEDRCFVAGMDGYLTKPLESDALDAVLENVNRSRSDVAG